MAEEGAAWRGDSARDQTPRPGEQGMVGSGQVGSGEPNIGWCCRGGWVDGAGRARAEGGGP